MFIQVIQGRIGDKDAAKATLDRWLRDIEPAAVGWIGGTYGFTDNDTLVAIVRFDSKEAAMANSARSEQQAWWREMQAHFTGPITFHDCDDVTLLLGGGSDEARFVQVIQGRLANAARMRELASQSAGLISRYRPDILGATIAIGDDGFFTETIAFSSEPEARRAERQPIPPEASEVLDETMSLLDGVTYIDLHQPWFASHR